MLYNFTRVAEWLARLRPNSDTQDGPCKLLPRTLSLLEVSQMRSPIPEEVDGGDGTVGSCTQIGVGDSLTQFSLQQLTASSDTKSDVNLFLIKIPDSVGSTSL
ncbi:hypothetical protein BHE74_00050347 [Ensete ventricosum]|nr:hypothetical protein GW17_00024610 [Ensete ventricosum]RWW43933.1 hypothetical protein BHE74_00050347 [Ensete ventricosum]RZR90981.1 hypothetical protein BHM03_00019005 [Ensete ventricosum]